MARAGMFANLAGMFSVRNVCGDPPRSGAVKSRHARSRHGMGKPVACGRRCRHGTEDKDGMARDGQAGGVCAALYGRRSTSVRWSVLGPHELMDETQEVVPVLWCW